MRAPLRRVGGVCREGPRDPLGPGPVALGARVDVERDQVNIAALRPDGTTIDRAIHRHEGWTDGAPAAPERSGPATAPPPPEAPETPEDWSWVWKAIPSIAVVGAGAWWLRRRSQ